LDFGFFPSIFRQNPKKYITILESYSYDNPSFWGGAYIYITIIIIIIITIIIITITIIMIIADIYIYNIYIYHINYITIKYLTDRSSSVSKPRLGRLEGSMGPLLVSQFS